MEQYRKVYFHQPEGFLSNWPEKYEIYGWLVQYKTGGSINPHIHEIGWVSGSIYINVPKTLNDHEGNLVVSLDENANDASMGEISRAELVVKTGDICLFPASLHHCTTPFESEEDRIVLAFDVLPA